MSTANSACRSHATCCRAVGSLIRPTRPPAHLPVLYPVRWRSGWCFSSSAITAMLQAGRQMGTQAETLLPPGLGNAGGTRGACPAVHPLLCLRSALFFSCCVTRSSCREVHGPQPGLPVHRVAHRWNRSRPARKLRTFHSCWLLSTPAGFWAPPPPAPGGGGQGGGGGGKLVCAPANARGGAAPCHAAAARLIFRTRPPALSPCLVCDSPVNYQAEVNVFDRQPALGPHPPAWPAG